LPPTSRNFTSNGYTVQLTQSLFHLANIMGYRQSGYLVKQAEAQLAQAEAELILKTAQTYYDMLLAKGTLEQLKAQKKAIAEQQAAAEMSYKIGAANITDVQEAKAKLELVNAQELEAENEIINKRLTLQTLAGKDISEPDGAHGEPSLPEPNDVNVWLSKVESNPSVKAATALLEAADTEVVKVKSGHLPSVDLVAAYGDNTQWSGANDPASTRTESKAVGVQVQFPIFSGGGTHAKVKEALLTRKKAKMDLENTKRQGALQINQAFVGVQLGVMQFKAQSAGVEASETALKSNNTGYSVGIRTNMDVLNAQQQLYAAMRDMNRARYNVLMQMLKLKTFTGENLDFQINPAKPVKDNNENKGR
jgi:outer membrane protein